ncbi:MAG: S1 RNA-binding domain-containing protein [Anaerolineales bacterium]|nr:S1 RNA-binding domain-containing protein [Anaerolineales bacterium]
MTEDTSTATSQPDNLAALRPKMRLHGTVSSIEIFGILVDVGVGRDALVHISELNVKGNENSGNNFEIGQSITVWVKQVEKKAKRVTLTLQEPPAVDWQELKPGQVYSGKVIRIEKFGAFVDIGAELSGLVHVREITTGRVAHPDEVVTLDEEVEVQVIGVNRRKRQIDLSMRALEQQAVDDGEDEEPPPTAMELALRAAMEGQPVTERPARKKRKTKSGNPQQELLQRTLDNRGSE